MNGFLYQDLGRIDYQTALACQQKVFDHLIAAQKDGRKEAGRLLFCEHNSVFTLGKHGKKTNLLLPQQELEQRGISFFDTDRGGDITYHGPGQLTGYPIFDLNRWNMGLRQYIHTLEEIIIRLLALYRLPGSRLPGAAGVWIDPSVPGRARKVAAIGVKSSRYVTMHGFALNVCPDLGHYALINPCGFTDKKVTSLAQELGEAPDMESVKGQLAALFREVFP